MTQFQNPRKYLIAVAILLIAGTYILIKHKAHDVPITPMTDSISQKTIRGKQVTDLRPGIVATPTVKENAGSQGDSSQLTRMEAAKESVFVFDNKDLKAILKELGKWYNLEVQYKGAISKKTHFGIFSKSEKIADILKFLQERTKVRLTIENSTIIVQP